MNLTIEEREFAKTLKTNKTKSNYSKAQGPQKIALFLLYILLTIIATAYYILWDIYYSLTLRSVVTPWKPINIEEAPPHFKSPEAKQRWVQSNSLTEKYNDLMGAKFKKFMEASYSEEEDKYIFEELDLSVLLDLKTQSASLAAIDFKKLEKSNIANRSFAKLYKLLSPIVKNEGITQDLMGIVIVAGDLRLCLFIAIILFNRVTFTKLTSEEIRVNNTIERVNVVKEIFNE